MENKEEIKYYTPEISEFYIGFEYESKSGFMDGTVKQQEDYDNSPWRLEVMDEGLPYIGRALHGINAKNGICGIRVKYLDQEDIECLGFEIFKPERAYGNLCKDLLFFKKDDVEIRFDKDSYELGILIDDKIRSRDGLGRYKQQIVFRGIIKNKSVLKQVLKMIGVTE